MYAITIATIIDFICVITIAIIVEEKICLCIIVHVCFYVQNYTCMIIEGSLEVKLPTIWTDEKQSREEAKRRERLEERRVEEKEYMKKEDADA